LDKASKGRTTITIAHRLSTIKDAAKTYIMGDGIVLEQGQFRTLACYRLKNSRKWNRGIPKLSIPLEPNTPIPGLVLSGDPSDLNAMLREKQKERMAKERADKEIEEAAFTEKSLGRADTSKLSQARSSSSRSCNGATPAKGPLHGTMAHINRESWKLYALGIFASACTLMVCPSFGIVFGKLCGQLTIRYLGHLIQSFQYPGHELEDIPGKSIIFDRQESTVSNRRNRMLAGRPCLHPDEGSLLRASPHHTVHSRL
jgi:ATP-binding cassette subfamily B (MDR/TAP) protein 1